MRNFDPKAAKRSPEEFVLSRNLRRRHLSTGQKAAIALEWADQIEFSPRSENAKTTGRPRGALLEAAKHIGIERQRIFEARQIRENNGGLYKELKAGRRSLNSALEEIKSTKPENRARQETDEGSRTRAVKESAPNGKTSAIAAESHGHGKGSQPDQGNPGVLVSCRS